MKIKKGDKVKVISGNSRGQEGVVEKAFPKEGKITIAGVNVVKKHRRQRGPNKPGGIIEIAKPINVSNVMLVCPHCQTPTRIGYEFQGDEKLRLCKKCHHVIK